MRRLPTNGFTLVELLIVVAIFAVLTVLAAGVASNALPKNQLAVETRDLMETLRRAQARTVSGQADGVWGVHVTSNDFTLFQGATYAGRDTNYDEVHALESTITASGLTDVVFDARTGETSDTGTITLTSSVTGETATVTINAYGRATDS